MMQLRTYLARQGLKIEAFARKAGLSQSEVSRLVSGHRSPRPATIEKIEAATKGQVRARDFVLVPHMPKELPGQ